MHAGIKPIGLQLSYHWVCCSQDYLKQVWAFGYCQPLQLNSRWTEQKQTTGELGPCTSLSFNQITKPQTKKKKIKFSNGKQHETIACDAMFCKWCPPPFSSLNGLHFTLPCILATAISASFQSCINHCGENVWEICAVRSVPRMPPFLCFVCFFFQELHLLISKHQMSAHP